MFVVLVSDEVRNCSCKYPSQTDKIMHASSANSVTGQKRQIDNYTNGLEDDIPWINFKQNINSNSQLKISRHQFPFRPRYAMTSNIVQGKTIEHMLLDLRHDPFAHGQLHVSCSRVPQASQHRVLTFRERIINNRAQTVNVVDETCKAMIRSVKKYITITTILACPCVF